MSPENHFEEISIFWKKIFLKPNIKSCVENNRIFGDTFWAGLLKLHWICLEERFWEKTNFRTKYKFLSPFSEIWRRYSVLAEWNLAGLSKVMPTCTGLNYEENFIVLEVTNSWSILQFWRKNFGRVIKTRVYVFWSTLSGKFSFWQKIVALSNWVLSINFGLLL